MVHAIIDKSIGTHFDPVVVQAFQKIIPPGEAENISREDRPATIVG
jgi:response regulator RpfG family c-di-GMP phosphodiesterase